MADESRKAEITKDVGLFGGPNLKKGQIVSEAELGTATFDTLHAQGYAKHRAAATPATPVKEEG